MTRGVKRASDLRAMPAHDVGGPRMYSARDEGRPLPSMGRDITKP
eukprot:CAMPEP_0185359864 /NCGR_PEP_ID=MMETSP1364-20130426/9203_1 /TAXON_ID=38817 /ORGANISM="Gephyrocapsa oceanica, Strain RCC1303" /LENGTH=44 /DNA_ID= /DNA_START= /DNA_END= /DNA_ORIENTATION=